MHALLNDNYVVKWTDVSNSLKNSCFVLLEMFLSSFVDGFQVSIEELKINHSIDLIWIIIMCTIWYRGNKPTPTKTQYLNSIKEFYFWYCEHKVVWLFYFYLAFSRAKRLPMTCIAIAILRQYSVSSNLTMAANINR